MILGLHEQRIETLFVSKRDCSWLEILLTKVQQIKVSHDYHMVEM